MNREEIIRMARDAGIDFQQHSRITGKVSVTTRGSQPLEKMERFAALVAAAEREACAKVCESQLGPTATDYYGKRYAAAIRARGTP